MDVQLRASGSAAVSQPPWRHSRGAWCRAPRKAVAYPRTPTALLAHSTAANTDVPTAHTNVGAATPLYELSAIVGRRQRVNNGMFNEILVGEDVHRWTAQPPGLSVGAIIFGFGFGFIVSQTWQALFWYLNTFAWFRNSVETVDRLVAPYTGRAVLDDEAIDALPPPIDVNELENAEDGTGTLLSSSSAAATSASASPTSASASPAPLKVGGRKAAAPRLPSVGPIPTADKDVGESLEWLNTSWRKAWRVYQRLLEQFVSDSLQLTFDELLQDEEIPSFIKRIRVDEVTLDHIAPIFSNMRRRNSRADSELILLTDLRYSGGFKMLIVTEIGFGWFKFDFPLLISDLDLDCQLWFKLKLAPVAPWVGKINVAFVGPPSIKLNLAPFKTIPLFRVPVVRLFLRKILTEDLPASLVLPKRIAIDIPPDITAMAAAAVGKDTIMRAVASAVLQTDALEKALLTALPVGPQVSAGGIILPQLFKGELTVTLVAGRNLPVWGFRGQSNPYGRLSVGEQVEQSRNEFDTGTKGRHRNPVWNQEFMFLIKDVDKQVLVIDIKDSHITGRIDVGRLHMPLFKISSMKGSFNDWIPLEPPEGSELREGGEVMVNISYKQFDDEDEEDDLGFDEAEAFAKSAKAKAAASGEVEDEFDISNIFDIRSAAAASSKLTAEASAAISQVAMTQAAAARVALRRAQTAAEEAAKQVAEQAPAWAVQTAASAQQAAASAQQAASYSAQQVVTIFQEQVAVGVLSVEEGRRSAEALFQRSDSMAPPSSAASASSSSSYASAVESSGNASDDMAEFLVPMSAPIRETKSVAPPQDVKERPWWQLFDNPFEGSSSKEAPGGEQVNKGKKPIDFVQIPADLDIAEVARELAVMRDNVGKAWNNAVEDVEKAVQKQQPSSMVLAGALVLVALISYVAGLEQK